MNNALTRTASVALERAGGLASTVKDGVTHWVPAALRAITTGAQLTVLRDGGRKAVKVVRKYPAATAATVVVAAGAGIALWLLRRNSRRRNLDEDMRAIEVTPVRVTRRAQAKRVPRKTAVKADSSAS